MKQRISEREIIEAIKATKARTAALEEVNRMMRDMIADLHAINEELAAERRARRENGKNND